MVPQPPAGQAPVDPQGAFTPPQPPSGGPAAPGGMPQPTPYPMPMPWPMMPMYGPPPKQRSIGMIICTAVATIIFGGSLLLNLIFMLSAGLSKAEPSPVKQTVMDAGSADRVAVVPLHGIVNNKMAEEFDKIIKTIEKDKSVKALVLDIDTPGGSVAASDAIYHRVLKFKDGRKVPVVVSMGGMATSGGYYISCAADYLYASPTTLTGNIGVIMPNLNFSGMTKKWGIEDATIAAPSGGYKNAGSPFREMSDRDTAYYQGLIDGAFAKFRDVVKKGRGTKIKIDEVADGRVFTADQALQNGLVDKAGYLDDATAYAATTAGLNKPSIVKYQLPTSLLGSLFGSEDAKAGAGSLNVNGVKVEVSSQLIDELATPRLMYMWRGQ